MSVNEPDAGIEKEKKRKHAKMIIQRSEPIAAMSMQTVIKGLDLNEAINQLTEESSKVSDGDLTALKRMLYTQAKTLDTHFHSVLQAADNAKGDMVLKRYHLAVKLQNASRATVEALNEILNPKRVLFAQQANIAGQQIVANGEIRTEKKEGLEQANELKQMGAIHHATLDSGIKATASRTDARTMPAIADMGTQHRGKNTRG